MPGNRLYGWKWRKRREGYLREHPLCAYCKAIGRLTASSIVDHKVPHRGDLELFWDEANWQPLCKTCHDAAKRAEEHGSGLRGVDADGMPIDAGHHWRAGPR